VFLPRAAGGEQSTAGNQKRGDAERRMGRREPCDDQEQRR
jgi:hypothetical protein